MSRTVFWSHGRFFGNNCHGHSKKVMGKKTLNFELLDFPQLFTRAKKKSVHITMEIPYPYSVFPKQSVPVPVYAPQFDPEFLPYPYPYSVFKNNPYPSYLRTTKWKFSRPPYLLRLRTKVRVRRRRRNPSTHSGPWGKPQPLSVKKADLSAEK